MQVQIALQAAQRRADVRRILHQQAHQPQLIQAGVRADQQTEMRAAVPTTQWASSRLRAAKEIRLSGVVEQLQFNAGLGEDLSGIGAQAPNMDGIASEPPMRTVASAGERITVLVSLVMACPGR